MPNLDKKSPPNLIVGGLFREYRADDDLSAVKAKHC